VILSTNELREFRNNGLERDEVAGTCVRVSELEPEMSYMNGGYSLEDHEVDQNCAI
jgi:hypothetical protein